MKSKSRRLLSVLLCMFVVFTYMIPGQVFAAEEVLADADQSEEVVSYESSSAEDELSSSETELTEAGDEPVLDEETLTDEAEPQAEPELQVEDEPQTEDGDDAAEAEAPAETKVAETATVNGSKATVAEAGKTTKSTKSTKSAAKAAATETVTDGDDAEKPTRATKAAGTTVLAFTSDVHNTNSTGSNFNTWINKVVQENSTIDYMGFCGDMADGTGSNATSYWSHAKVIMNIVDGLNINACYTTGNHEYSPGDYNYSTHTSSSSSTDNKAVAEKYTVDAVPSNISSGADYQIYCLGSASGDQKYTDDQATSLETFLSKADSSKPIFIVSHFPLHTSGSRSTTNAGKVIEKLNAAADAGQTIIFLWGHNHTIGDSNYGKIYGPNTVLSTKDGDKTIKFYYAGAGCMKDGDSTTQKGLIATIGNNAKAAGTTVTLTAIGSSGTALSSSDASATINVTASSTYTLTDKLEVGKDYLIATANSDSAYILSSETGTTSGSLKGYSVNVIDGKITLGDDVDESKVAFSCIQDTNYSSDANMTWIVQGDQSKSLYMANSTNLSLAAAVNGKCWHYIADDEGTAKNLLWFFNGTSGDYGYTATGTQKYYLKYDSNGNFTKGTVANANTIKSENTPAIYLFVKGDGSGGSTPATTEYRYVETNEFVNNGEYLVTVGEGNSVVALQNAGSGSLSSSSALTVQPADDASAAYVKVADTESAMRWTYTTATRNRISNSGRYLTINSSSKALETDTSGNYAITYNANKKIELTYPGSSSGNIYYVKHNGSNFVATSANASADATTIRLFVKTEVETDPIELESIALNESSLEMQTGDTETLTVTYTPTDATNKAVTWSTSNDSVATVANGVVTAVGAGTAVITATSAADSNITASCNVTVTENTSITVTRYVETNAFVEGKNHIVAVDKSGSTNTVVALTNNSSEIGNTDLTVQSDSNTSYISTNDAKVLWKFNGGEKNYLTNQTSYYLNVTNSGDARDLYISTSQAYGIAYDSETHYAHMRNFGNSTAQYYLTFGDTFAVGAKNDNTGAATIRLFVETEVSIEPCETHTFGEPTWTWANDYSSATATFACSVCGTIQTVTDNDITVSTSGEANCQTPVGATTYTASVTFEGQTYTDTKSVSGGSASTLVTSVTSGETYVMAYESNGTYYVLYDNNGSVAVATLSELTTSTVTDAMKWTWTQSSSGTSYTVKSGASTAHYLGNSSSSLGLSTSSSPTYKPYFSTSGLYLARSSTGTKYYINYSNGSFTASSGSSGNVALYTIGTVQYGPHAYEFQGFTWNGTSAVGTYKCSVCNHEETVNATVEKTSSTAATCEDPAYDTYTATISSGNALDGNPRTDTKTVVATEIGGAGYAPVEAASSGDFVLAYYDGSVYHVLQYANSTFGVVDLTELTEDTVTNSMLWTASGSSAFSLKNKGASSNIYLYYGGDATSGYYATTGTSERKYFNFEDGKLFYYNTSSQSSVQNKHLYYYYNDGQALISNDVDPGSGYIALYKYSEGVETPSTPLGHDWDMENVEWSWDSVTSATATFTCKNDSSHTHVETATGDAITSAPGTGEYTGYTVYTATVNFNNQTLTNDKLVLGQCTVSFNAGEGSGTMDPVNVDYGSTYALPSNNGFNAPTGAKFRGWMIGTDTEVYDPGHEITITGDVVLTAAWIERYAVTLKSGDGTGEDITYISTTQASSFEYEGESAYFKALSNPFTAPTGCEFSGWKVNGEGDLITADRVQLTADQTILIAQWTPKEYTVTFYANEGDTEAFATATVAYGSAITLPEETPTKAFYTFANWKNVPTSMPAENISIYADWTAKDTYYVVGSMNNWTVSEEYELTASATTEGEFSGSVTLAAGNEIKVVRAVGGEKVNADHYPSTEHPGYNGATGNYTVDANHAGDVTLYFRPAGNFNDAGWQTFGGYFYIQGDNSIAVEVSPANTGTARAVREDAPGAAATSAPKDMTITVEYTPEDGYQLDKIELWNTNEEVLVQTLTTNTFSMPDYNVTVKVYFKAIVWTFDDFTWTGDDTNGYTAAVANYTGDNGATKTVDAVVGIDEEESKPATCTENGKTVYVASVADTASLDHNSHSESKEVTINKLNHDWGAVSYTWSEDYTHVTARRVCGNDSSHFEEETVAATGTVTTEPTCEGTGVKTWTSAAFDNPAFEAQTTTEILPAKQHAWGEVEYVWADDFSKVTATRICANDASHVETEEAAATGVVTTEPTCEGTGVKTWTSAAFDNPAFEAQTTTEILPAKQHDWKAPTWTWVGNDDDGYTSATATFVCNNDPSHTEPVTDDSIDVVPVPATPTTSGSVTYTASVTGPDGETYTDQKVVTIPAAGYTYKDPVYTWTETTNGWSVTALKECNEDSLQNITETVDAVYSEPTPATCTEPGKGLWTATFQNTAFETKTKEVDLPALGHDWHFEGFTWTPVSSGYTAVANYICQNDETHVQTVTASVSGEITDPTCDQDGAAVYTATVVAANTPDNQPRTDTKTDVIPATGHSWGAVTYEWVETDEGYICSASRVCATNPAHKESEDAVGVAEVTTPATCTTAGLTTYTATFENTAFETQTKEVEVPATGHEWGEPIWTWEGNDDDGYTAATATFTCANDSSHTETVTDDHLDKVSVAPTATESGSDTYTASVTGPDNKTYEKQRVVTVAPAGYTFGEVTYDWIKTTDGYDVKATKPCNENHDLDVVETVKATKTVVKEPTCEEVGEVRYTVSFDNSAFEAQTRTDAIPALGHDWGEVTYVWADDNSTCTATRVCSRDDSHVDTETATATAKVTKQPTCTAKGTTTYTAKFENKDFETQTKEVKDVPALGHDYQFKSWEWSEDHTYAIAKFTCSHNSGHKKNVSVDATVEKTEPTYEKDGSIVYTVLLTAADSPDGKKHSDKYTETIPALTAPAAKITNLNTDVKTSSNKIVLSYKSKNAVKYKIRYRVDGGKWKTIKTTEKSYSIKNIQANAYYDIKVAGINKAGKQGKYTSLRRRYTGGIKFKVKSPSKGLIKVTAKAKENLVGYQIRYNTNKTKSGAKSVKVKTTENLVKELELKSGTTYYVWVRPLMSRNGKTYIGVYDVKIKITVK